MNSKPPARRTAAARARAAGYPVRFPFVDLAEVSAGGGTIARLDDVGVLRVGPLSAGADPGPACYGKGTQPTVTDANVVLGRLNPVALVGGTFPIDAARSRDAVATVAAPLGGDVERTAAGIVALVDAEMAKVLRIVSVERGLDPRDFALMAFGGGGPLHACALADDLGMRRVIVPRYPGFFQRARAARGRRARDVLAFARRAARCDVARQRAARRGGARRRGARGVARARRRRREDSHGRRTRRALYAGQSFDLTVPFDGDAAAIADAFHRAPRTPLRLRRRATNASSSRPCASRRSARPARSRTPRSSGNGAHRCDRRCA